MSATGLDMSASTHTHTHTHTLINHNCSASAHHVDLSEHRALAEEQRLPGVHEDQIKVGLPVPVGDAGLHAKQAIKSHTHTHTHTL